MTRLFARQAFAGMGRRVQPPAFKSASSYNGSSASSHAVTMPATFAAGDLLIATLFSETGKTISSMTGWTQITTGGSATRRIYRKIAAGSDTATVGLSGAGTLEASIAAYGPTTGIDGTPTGDDAFTDVTLSAITVTTAGGLLIAAAGVTSGNTLTTPSGFTQDNSATPDTTLIKYYSKVIASSGSTGTVLIDQSGTGALMAALIYIKP